jgi:hypothetical protein
MPKLKRRQKVAASQSTDAALEVELAQIDVAVDGMKQKICKTADETIAKMKATVETAIATMAPQIRNMTMKEFMIDNDGNVASALEKFMKSRCV